MNYRVGAIVALTILQWGNCFGADQDYAARFKELHDQKAEGPKIDALLDEWRAQKPDNPDAWITSANYYFNQSVGPMISTKKADKSGDYTLKNKKTGKEAGSISFKPGVAQTTREASDLLQEATGKFPDRLDIWCGLSWMYQERGEFDNEFATLKKMVAYVHEHPTNLKWLKGAPIEEPSDEFVAEKLHSYGMYYGKKDTPVDDNRLLQISMFAAEQFPKRPYAFNDVAVYYSMKGDDAKTREWLEKANQVDPTDTLVMTNLGYICSKMGDKTAARKWFEASIKTEPDGENSERAKEGLKKLK